MIWSILMSLTLFLADVAWLISNRNRCRPVRFALSLVGSIGFIVLLACTYISNLPSHAPLRTVTGLAIDRTSGILNRHHSTFVLEEWKTGDRFIFSTTIDGPWANEPVLATYVDDGKFRPSVVRIAILSEDQVPTWHVEKGHAGWVGTAEAKRRAPTYLYLVGFLLLLLNFLAPVKREPGTDEA